MQQKFGDFSVGELVCFTRQFNKDDFERFAEVSGDYNPLHHSHSYALGSGHESTIVPLHLILAPLSRIAGMNFPGVPSLYLGHTVRAINKLRFGETLTYSAKVISLNVSKRILTLRVLGIRGADLIFDAEMQTHALHEHWEQELDCEIINESTQKRVLITGASGEIASSVAKLFYKNGWSLLLQQRDVRKEKRMTFENELESSVVVFEADLNSKKGLSETLERINGYRDIQAVIHLASPPVNAPLSQLVMVNYTALKSITETALPQMLANQNGVFLSVGSTAMLTQLDGFEDYGAAKSMAAHHLAKLDNKWNIYDVRGRVLAPSYVSTEYSKQLRGDNPSLLPSEVAVQVFDVAIKSKKFMRIQRVDSIIDGEFGFSVSKTLGADSSESVVTHSYAKREEPKNQQSLSNILISIMKRILPTASTEEIAEGGMGITPGWDSLAHIQIMLEVEKSLNEKFTSVEFAKIQTFDELQEIFRSRA